jgi:RNA polymerase sigma-70 factor (ECF subfamily)
MTETDPKHTEIHKALIERCRNNDRKAQIDLYNFYHQAIYNTCFRILRSSGLSEDVMQESFITAFEKIGTFKGDSTFGAWLKRIAVNKSIDELRRRILIFQPMDDSLENIIPDESDITKFGSENEIADKVEIIKKALGLLPDGYRVVLSLYLFEGYDHEEIAQILEITESTSRSQYTRARQKLLEILYHKFGMSNEMG